MIYYKIIPSFLQYCTLTLEYMFFFYFYIDVSSKQTDLIRSALFLWRDILVYFFKQTVRVMLPNERRDRLLTGPELLVAVCQPPRKSVFDSASVKQDFFF